MTVKAVKKDPATEAKYRALVTLGQGAVAAAGVAVTTAVGTWVTGGTWDVHTLEVSAGTAALTGVVTYLHRRFMSVGK